MANMRLPLTILLGALIVGGVVGVVVMNMQPEFDDSRLQPITVQRPAYGSRRLPRRPLHFCRCHCCQLHRSHRYWPRRQRPWSTTAAFRRHRRRSSPYRLSTTEEASEAGAAEAATSGAATVGTTTADLEAETTTADQEAGTAADTEAAAAAAEQRSRLTPNPALLGVDWLTACSRRPHAPESSHGCCCWCSPHSAWSPS